MTQQKYTLGKGRVYFDRFKPGTNIGTGERYLGNTPEFSSTSEAETLDHFSSEGGLREKDESVLLEISTSGSLTCDNIDAENVALFFLGESTIKTSLALTDQREVFAQWKRGTYLQLGTSADYPSGVRKVGTMKLFVAASNAVVDLKTALTGQPGVTAVSADSYSLDSNLGRFYIEPTATDIVGDVKLLAEYNVDAQSRSQIVSANNQVQGALRFISDNPVGENKDYFFPKVTLSPDGDYALKGDDWQTMGFTFDALKLGDRQRVYIDVRAVDAAGGDPVDDRYVTAIAKTTSSAVGTQVPVTVIVRDGNNNTVAGETVTFVATNGATLSEPQENTGLDGSVAINVSMAGAGSTKVTASVTRNGKTTSAQTATIAFT